MSDFPYPFQEFLDHLAALEIVSKYEYVTLSSGKVVELSGEPGDAGDMIFRVLDYMRQLYSDEAEVFYKGARFMVIVHHMSSHLPAFEDARLAIIGGMGDPSVVDLRAWRALHHFFAELGIPEDRITTAEIIAYALALPAEGEDPNRTGKP